MSLSLREKYALQASRITWTKELRKLKDFKIDVLTVYFHDRGVVLSEYCKGYKFFAEGYIHAVEVEENSDLNQTDFSVRAKCYHSQRRNEKPHNLHFTFSQPMKLKECRCSCLIGLSESCHHLIGFGYYLEDLTSKGATIIPDDLTCTSQAMTWNKPRGPKISPENIMQVVFAKCHKIARKRKPVQYRHFIPKVKIRKAAKDVNNNIVEDHKQRVMTMCQTLKSIDPHIAMSFLINVQNEDDSMTTIEMQKAHVENAVMNVRSDGVDNCVRPSLPCLEPTTTNILISLPLPKADECFTFTFEKSQEIETKTREQSQCREWFEARRNRFTASNFKKICRRRKAFDSNFLNGLWEHKDLSRVRTVQHGKIEERNARDLYVTTTGNKVFLNGLVIHPYAPHLGATPDGIVFDKTNGYGLLEIKCPCGKQTSTLSDALRTKTFVLKYDENNEIEVRMDHEYFYQIQGQMLVTGLLWSDLAIFFKKSNELIVKRIIFDEAFNWKMYSKLTDIFNKHVVLT